MEEDAAALLRGEEAKTVLLALRKELMRLVGNW